MSVKMEIFRLEDRVLFEAGAAAEIIEAAEQQAAVNGAAAEQSADADGGDAENTNDPGNAEPEAADGIPQADGADLTNIEAAAGDDPASVPAADMDDAAAGLDFASNPALPDMAAADGFIPETDIPVIFDTDGEAAGNTISTEKELVVVNSSVADKDAVLASLDANQEALILESGTDGLGAVNAYLDEHAETKYVAIHFVTHGNDGYFSLNGEIIDSGNVDADAWRGIGEHLTDDGDILLYGCELAKNESGRELCGLIADASGADVAASTDTTGISGDWDLEYNFGSVTADSLTVEGYAHNLTSYTVNTASGDAATEGSLAWAVSQANSNAGTDEIIFSRTLDGTAVNITARLTISGDVTISGNGEANTILDGGGTSGIFTISNNINVTLDHLTIQNGYGDASGGAIISNGTLTLDQVTFSGNKAVVSGGAIVVNNGGWIKAEHAAFTGNTAGNSGGAIYYNGRSSGVSIFADTVFTGNSSTGGPGGAICGSYSGTSVPDSALTITDSIFDGNTSSTHGGAIYEQWGAGRLTIERSTFTGNVAGNGKGGAVFAGSSYGRTTLITDSTFSGNKTTGAGGAINFSGSSTGDFERNLFVGNTATENGGAIHFDSVGQVTILDSTLTGNTASGGGGIFLVNYSSGSLLNMANTTITGNTANYCGGLFVQAQDGVANVVNCIVTGNLLSNGTLTTDFRTQNATSNINVYYTAYHAVSVISGNINIDSATCAVKTATDIFDTNTLADNGGWTKTIATAAPLAGADLTVYRNADTGLAEGMSFPDSSDTPITWGTTTGTAEKHITDQRGYYFASAQQGAYNTASYVAWSGDAEAAAAGNVFYSSIQAGIDANPGTLYLADTRIPVASTLTVTSGTITIAGTDAHSTSLDGGNSGGAATDGVRIMTISAGAEVSISNTGMRNAYSTAAETNVGAGAIRNAGTLNLKNMIFENNRSAYAGAVANQGGAVTVEDSLFYSNSSISGVGGAIYNQSGTLAVSGSSFEENTNGDRGGAIYINGTATIENSSFTANSNTGSGGGAIFVVGSLTLTDVRFSLNTAAKSGGAVYSIGTLNARNVTFLANQTVSNAGAAIYNNGTATIDNARFVNNSTNFACTVYNGKNLILTNASFVGNRTVNWGSYGNIGATANGVLANCTFTDNAGNAAIWVEGSLTVVNSTVADNAGYGILMQTNTLAHSLTLVNSIVTDNSAKDIATAQPAGNERNSISIYNSLYGTAQLDSSLGVLKIFNSRADVASSEIFTGVSNTVVNNVTQTTFALKTDGPANGAGVRIYHNADWTELAFSRNTGGSLYYVLGTAGADTLLTADQTGAAIEDASSIGAVYQVHTGNEVPSLLVTTAADTVDATDNEISLREAILYANAMNTLAPGAYTISFMPGLTTLTLNGEIEITTAIDLTIDGSVSAGYATILAGANARVFQLSNGADLTLYHTTLQGNGKLAGTTKAEVTGGLVRLGNGGSLTVDASVLRDGQAGYGGAVGAWDGNATLIVRNDSKILSNQSNISGVIATGVTVTPNGGAVYMGGRNNIMTVSDALFQANSTRDQGGTFFLIGTNLTVEDTVFDKSSSTSQGALMVLFAYTNATMKRISVTGNTGGYYGALTVWGANVYIENSSFVGNAGALAGAFIDVRSGSLYMTDSTVAGTTSNGCLVINGGSAYIANSILTAAAANSTPAIRGTAANLGKLTLVNTLYSGAESATFNANSTNNWSTSVLAVFDDKNQTASITDYTAAGADLTAHVATVSVTPSASGFAAYYGSETAFDPTARVLYYYNKATSSWKNIATGINAAVDNAWKVTTDQTGAVRSARSIGAVSVADPGADPEHFDRMVVTTAQDTINLLDGLLSLREAQIYASSGDTVTFDRTVFTAAAHTITLNDFYGEIVLNGDISIDGDLGGGNRVVFKVPVTYVESLSDGTTATASRLFTIGQYVTASIMNMELYGGSTDQGGTIYVSNGALTLTNVVAGDSSASGSGGVIAVYDRNNTFTKNTTLTIRNSVIRNGKAYYRGGLIDASTENGNGTNANFGVYIYDSLLTGGKAGVGGGLSLYASTGIHSTGGWFEIAGSTFRGNSTYGTTAASHTAYGLTGSNAGAALAVNGYSNSDAARMVYGVISNSTFAENTDSRSTVAIAANVRLNIADSTFANNATTDVLAMTASPTAANRLGKINLLNNIVLGNVTGTNAPELNAKYTVFSVAPTGFSAEITADNGNVIGGAGIDYESLFTGEWTAADGRLAQTLMLKSGVAVTLGGVLTAAETWDNWSTAGYTAEMWYKADGAWRVYSTGELSDSDPQPDYLLANDQVGRSRSAYESGGQNVFCVGAYTFALEDGSLVVNGVGADNPYDGMTTFNEALTYAKTLLPGAADEVAITFSDAYFNDTRSEAARTVTLAGTVAYNAAMYHYLAIRGNGKVFMTTQSGVQHFFSVSGAADALTLEGITFRGDAVTAGSAGATGKFLESGVANLTVTLTNVSMSGFGGSASGNTFKITGDGLKLNITGGTYTGTGTENGQQGSFLYYYKSGASITLKDAVFENYRTVSQGGMFYLNGSNNTVTLDGAELSRNTAPSGGAIYTKGTGFTLVMKNGAVLSANTAANGSGGAVYIEGANAVLSITDSTVRDNTGNGGNTYGGAIDVNGAGAAVTVENSTFSGNSLVTTGTGSTYGGALSVRGAGEKVTLNDVTAENNSSWGSGGFLYLAGNDFTFSLDGGSYTDNTARASSKNVTMGGGALYLSSGKSSVTNASISDALFARNTAGYENNSSSGGAVYFAGQLGKLNLSNTEFDRNVSNFFGGALTVRDAVFTGDRLTFTGNEGRRGGAVMFQTAGAVNKAAAFFTNSLFDGNSASVTGGGIFMSGGYSTGSLEICIENTTFVNNYAKYVGGAVSVGDRSVVNLLNCTVTGNKIGSAAGVTVSNDSGKTMVTGGAGVYIGQNAPDMDGQQNGNGGPLTLADCIVVGNTDNADDAAGTHAAADIRSTTAGYYGDYNVIGVDGGTKTINGTHNTTGAEAGSIYDLSDPAVYDSASGRYLVDANGLLQVSAAGSASVNTDKLVYGRYFDTDRYYYAFSADGGSTWQGRKDANLVTPAAGPVKLMTDPTGLYRVGWRTAGAAQYQAAIAWREYSWDGSAWVDGFTVYTDLSTAFITDSGKIASGETAAPEVFLAGSEIDLGDTVYTLANNLAVSGTDNTILINGNFEVTSGVRLTISDLTYRDGSIELLSGSSAVTENVLLENSSSDSVFQMNGNAQLALVNSTYYGSTRLAAFSNTGNTVSLVDSTLYQTDGGFWTLNAGVTLNAVNSIVAAYLIQDGSATLNAAYSVFLNAENELGPFDVNTANTFGVTAESLFGATPALDRGALVIQTSSAAWHGGAQAAFNAGTMSSGYSADNGETWTAVAGTGVVKSDWLRHDQRGEFRLGSADGSAAGAYSGLAEVQSTVVTIAGERVNAYDGYISLREAMMYAKELGGGADHTVTFDVEAIRANASITTELGETVDLTPYFVYDSGNLTLRCSETTAGYPLDVYSVAGTVLAINGANAVALTQLSGVTQRLFEVCDGATLNLAKLTLQGTKGGTKLSVQGSLVYTGGTFNADGVTFRDTFSSERGSMLRYVAGTMNITECVFTGASGGGSAVHIENGTGTNTFVDCSFTDNREGNTLHLHNGSKNYFTNCTISDNAAGNNDLIYIGYAPAMVEFASCTIENNTANNTLIGGNTTNIFRLVDSTVTGNTAKTLISVNGNGSEISGSVIANNTATGDDLISANGTSERLVISGTAITGNIVSTADKALIRGCASTDSARHTSAVEIANSTVFGNTADTLFRTVGTAVHYVTLTSNTIVSNTFADAAISGVNGKTDLALVSNIILGNAGGDVCVTAANSYGTGYNLTGTDTGTAVPVKAVSNLNGVTSVQVFGTAAPALAADGKSIELPASSPAIFNGIMTASYFVSNTDRGTYISLDGENWTDFLDSAAVKTTAEITAKNYSVVNTADIREIARGTLTAAGSYDIGSDLSAITGDYRTTGSGELVWQASSFETKVVIGSTETWVALSGWRLAMPDNSANSLTVVANTSLTLDAADRTINHLTVEANAVLTGGAGSLTLPEFINFGTVTFKAGGTLISGVSNNGGTLTFGTGGTNIQDNFTNGGTLTGGTGSFITSGEFNNSGTFTLGAGGLSIAFGEFANSGTLTQGAAAGVITVGDGMTAAELTNTGALVLGGAIVLSAGASTDFSASGSCVTYNGGNQTILAGTYCDLTLSASAANTKTLAGDVAVNGAFTAHGVDNTVFLTLDGAGHTLTLADSGTRTAQSGRVTYTDIRNLTAVNSANADGLLYINATNTVADTAGIRVVIPVAQVAVTNGGSLVYGQTLADATVTGTVSARGTAVAGAFAYTNGATKPAVADSDLTAYALTFTPVNSAYLVDAGTSTVHVTQAAITIGALAAVDKNYNGSTADAVLTAQTLTGANGETFTLTGSGDYADAHAAGNISVSFDELTLAATGSALIANYTFVYQGQNVSFDGTTGKMTGGALAGSGDIVKRNITVSFDRLTKTYDGTDGLALADNMYSFTNLVASESLTMTAVSGKFSTYRANVAGTTVSFSGLALGNAASGDGLAADYLLVDGEGNAVSSVSGLTGSISKAALTVTIFDTVTEGGIVNGETFVYGSKGHASLAGEAGTLAATDALSGTIAIQTTAGLSSAEYYNAGSHTASAVLTLVNTAEGGADVTDCYDISFDGVTAFTVTPKTLTDVQAGSRVYDATAEFSGATTALGEANGVVGEDKVSSMLCAVMLPDSAIGDYAVIAAGNATLSGTDAANYVLPENVTVTITARAVVLTGADGHVYGGADSYSGDNLVSGHLFSGYLVTDTGLSGAGEYAAGTHHASGLGSIVILDAVGANVTANYTLTLGENIEFGITRKTISASDIENLNKTYDATTEFTFSAGNLTGVLAGDTVAIDNATVQTSSPDAGVYQVALDGVALQGADSANYLLAGDAEITVNQRRIVVTGISGLYGEPETLVGEIGGAQGLVGADALTGRLETDLGLSRDGEYMAGLHTIAGLGTFSVEDGNGGANYQVVLASSITEFTIDKRSVTITANPVSYDAAAGGGVTLSYTVSGDKLAGTDRIGGELACPALNTAANGEYAITQGTVAVLDHGTVSKNYQVTFVGASVTVSGVGGEDGNGGVDAFQYPAAGNINNTPDMYSIVVNGEQPRNGTPGASSAMNEPVIYGGGYDTRMISTTEYQLDRSIGFLLASENARIEARSGNAFQVEDDRIPGRDELRGSSVASVESTGSALRDLLIFDAAEQQNAQARKLGLTVFDAARTDGRPGCSVAADELSGSGEFRFSAPEGSLSQEAFDFADAAEEIPADAVFGKAALCKDDLDLAIEEMLAI